VPNIAVGDTVHLAGGKAAKVLEVHDDEEGQDGDVRATVIVDVS
jgi:hypothetical protein